MFGFLKADACLPGYRQAYARCCAFHHLDYGVEAMPFLSHEGVFAYAISLDANAHPGPPARTGTCCKLRTSRSMWSDPDAPFGRFASAAGMLLAWIKLEDDARDEPTLLPRLARWRLRDRFARARRYLDGLNADFDRQVDAVLNDHADIEKKGGPIPLDRYAEPTARGFAALFALLARPMARPDLADPLARIGHALGSAIIGFDCAVDLEHDCRRGHFNPLRSRSEADETLAWSVDRLRAVASTCRAVFGAECLSERIALSCARRVLRRECRQVNVHSLLERWGILRDPRYVYAGMDCPSCECDFCQDCELCGNAFNLCEGGGNPFGDACLCGEHACTRRDDKPSKASVTDRENLIVGQVGVTATDMRPSGVVKVAGKRFTAKSNATRVPAGTHVRVVGVRNKELDVEPVEPDDEPDPSQAPGPA